MKINIEINDGELIHIWEGSGAQIMVSKEETKTLTSFTSADDAISALYLAGHKTAARKLHAVNKEAADHWQRLRADYPAIERAAQ